MITLRQFPESAKVFTALQSFALVCATGTKEEILKAANDAAINPLFAGKGWQSNIRKFIRVALFEKPVFKVFAIGNSKLPFLSYSELPIVTCPGAGDCLSFCYSVTAWRYPAAFFRQAQNTVLARFNPAAIQDALDSMLAKRKFAKLEKVDFRLFVDGDFSSLHSVAFWQNTIRNRPQLAAYGYTKSFNLFLQYEKEGGQFASNYMVNLSSGHNADSDTAARFTGLPVVRGAFKAVNVGYNVTSAMHGTAAHNKALRAAYGQKAFTCPGKCGECTPSGHACGSPKFKSVDIIIAVH